jgi:hypothetical protein
MGLRPTGHGSSPINSCGMIWAVHAWSTVHISHSRNKIRAPAKTLASFIISPWFLWSTWEGGGWVVRVARDRWPRSRCRQSVLWWPHRQSSHGGEWWWHDAVHFARHAPSYMRVNGCGQIRWQPSYGTSVALCPHPVLSHSFLKIWWRPWWHIMSWSLQTEQEVVSEHVHRSQRDRGGLLPPYSAAIVDQKDKFPRPSPLRIGFGSRRFLSGICLGFGWFEVSILGKLSPI